MNDAIYETCFLLPVMLLFAAGTWGVFIWWKVKQPTINRDEIAPKNDAE